VQPRQATFFEMMAHLSQTYNNKFSDLLPQGDRAIRIMPGADIDAEALASTICPLGWFVATNSSVSVVVEPGFSDKYPLEPGDLLFHVSQTSYREAIYREAIASEGLKPSTGGRTRVNRHYPPRIFFALNLSAAFEFVSFQLKNSPPNLSMGQSTSTKTSQSKTSTYTEHDIDVYRVMVPGRIKFYRDVVFPGKRVWCKEPIAPAYVKMIRHWRKARKRLARLSLSS
jgi:hypothetical protein